MDNKRNQYLYLTELAKKLKKANTIAQKSAILDKIPDLISKLSYYFPSMNLSQEFALVVKAIIAIGQEKPLFGVVQNELHSELQSVLSQLWEVEDFYKEIGGLVGYQALIFQELIAPSFENYLEEEFRHPEGLNLSEDSDDVRKSILEGIKNSPQTAEIYPIGGAGDRLGLMDPLTGQPLPTACLKFLGFSLLEHLFRDLQAKENLYYRLTKKQVEIPVILMTSHEKRNQDLINEILENKHWFHRSKKSFSFCIQPQVPVVTQEGQWAIKHPLQPVMKPGGHGVIWKLLNDEKVFDKLLLQGITKALVRQINNPIAGTDHGLLAFCGHGFINDMHFGFSSCPRAVKTAEGVLVLREKKDGTHFAYTLSNIEYTDFKKYGIEDKPVSDSDPHSKFPSNTNILFVDVHQVQKKVQQSPFPGVLLNMKGSWVATDEEGQEIRMKCGRLETTMQNLSDTFIQTFDQRLDRQSYSKFKSYVTYNKRQKTISVAKNHYHEGKPVSETPVGCFEDILKNSCDLLQNYCNVKLASSDTAPCTFLYHPALGPLYSIISQKISGGIIHDKSELQLEISDVFFENLNLKGSLKVAADQIIGHLDVQNCLIKSDFTGKCTLINVRIVNLGLKIMKLSDQWKNQYEHLELLSIHLQGNGEFFAKDVCFEGAHSFVVPDRHKLTVTQENGQLKFNLEIIEKPTWRWDYQVGYDNRICLSYLNN